MSDRTGGTTGPALADVEALVAEVEDGRRKIRRSRRLRSLAIPAGVTLGWVVLVAGSSQWDRVVDHWSASLTMVFGSLVAGSTPQGGGAVAFPVLTKGLEVPSDVARTFALCVQSFGMGVAACTILLARRRIEPRVLMIMLPSAVLGFLAGYAVMSDGSGPFRPSVVPSAYVRVGFTVLVVAMAVVMWFQFRRPLRIIHLRLPSANARVTTCLVVGGLIGGVLSSQVGSGADVALYLVAVVLIGLDPRVGVATSVVLMATISLLGFLTYGVLDGQLNVTLDASDAYVMAVDGQSVGLVGDELQAVPPSGGTAPDTTQYDLYGMLLASVPIVVWGAPLGVLVASRVRPRQLVGFVLGLALVELLTTVIFVSELRDDPVLVATLVGGLAVAIGGVAALHRNRIRFFGLPGADPGTALTSDVVEARLGFERLLGDQH